MFGEDLGFCEVYAVLLGNFGMWKSMDPPVPYRAKYLSLLKLRCPVVEESQLEACANGCKKRRS